MESFTSTELRLMGSLSSPHKLQAFIDNLSYNKGGRICAADVLRQRKADCLEAAAFASLVLTYNKVENFLIDLSAVRDEDHVICVFKQDGQYGAVAKSKYLGLRYRTPAYLSLRELAMSYFENYFNYGGELSLRSYGKPTRLPKTHSWAFLRKYMIELEKSLDPKPHTKLFKKDIRFPRVSKLKMQKEIILRK